MMNTKVTEITDAFMVIKNDYASTKTLKIYIFKKYFLLVYILKY